MRARAALFLVLGILPVIRAAAREGVYYTRPVDVPAAGWVRVQLDLPEDHDHGELRILGPDGKPVPRAESPPPVRRVPARTLETSYPAAPCRVGVTASFCLVVLPPVPTSHLALEIAGSGVITYRLYDVRRGWALFETASARSIGGLLHLAPQHGSFERDSTLLLELSASEGPPPRLLGYRLERREDEHDLTLLTFQAARPGRHTVIYGDGRQDQELWAPRPSGATVVSIAPGPEAIHPLSPLPSSARDPGAPLERIALAKAWPVRAPGARPGEIVRLTLPDPVHAEYRGYYSALHLETHGREIRYVRDLEPETVPVIWLPGARPRPMGEAGISQLDLPLPSPGLPLVTIHLRARPAPFSRKVQVADGSAVLREQDWICGPDQPGFCALDLAVNTLRFQRSSHPLLRFLDGDNPPLPALDVMAWREQESLAFVWPRSRRVRLLTGATSTDFSTQSDELYREIQSRPSRRAWVEVPRQAGSSVTPAFAAAGVLLLALLGWRSRRRLRPALLLAALAALPGAARADAGHLYTRPVAVPSAGVVRVPLDLATLRHLGANGVGLRVFGPQGEEVPGWVQPYLSEDPTQAWSSRVQPGVRQEGSAVVLGADLAPVAPVPPHDGLWLELGGPGSVRHLRARIEGSGDRETWKTLAEGDFFERMPADNNQSTRYSLTYPSSQDPFLRITIPAAEAAGFQQAYLGVVSTIPRVLSVPGDRLDCESARQRTWCRLELPARWQRPVRLALDLAGPEEMAIRVYAAREGRLSPLVQAVRRSARGGSRFVLPILSGPLEGEALRIELQGVGGAPRVTGATLELVQPVAVFHAASPGLYELRYGDGRSCEGDANDRSPADSESSAWIAPGPESVRELPSLPRSATSPTTPLDGRFAAAWPVRVAGAKPGEIVRLEIPAEVYAHSRAFGDDVRLSAGGRQIPYIRQTADDPALALARQGLRPERSFIGGGRVYVRLPQPGLPLTTWQVTCGPQGRDRQEVQVSFAYKDENTYAMAYGKTDPLLPCRLDGDLKGLSETVGPRALELKLTASSPVDLALWRRRDVLVFVWPEEGPVVLRAGSTAGAPQYDLKVLRSGLLARPWRSASLGRKEPEVSSLPLLALLAGAGFALLLLRKALPDG